LVMVLFPLSMGLFFLFHFFFDGMVDRSPMFFSWLSTLFINC
jgi:hypothetical protein